MNYAHQLQAQERDIKAERQKTRRYFTNTTALEAFMAQVAEGAKVSDLARSLNISYAALYGVLNSTYKEQYQAARAAYTEMLAEKNLDMADKVEKGDLPPELAKASAGLRQWYMERVANEQWGQRSSMDVTHKGVVGLHLEAIRQLSQETVDGEFSEVKDDGHATEYRVDTLDSDHDGDDGEPGDGSGESHPLL